MRIGGSLPGVNQPVREAHRSLHLVPRLPTHGAVSLLPAMYPYDEHRENFTYVLFNERKYDNNVRNYSATKFEVESNKKRNSTKQRPCRVQL